MMSHQEGFETCCFEVPACSTCSRLHHHASLPGASIPLRGEKPKPKRGPQLWTRVENTQMEQMEQMASGGGIVKLVT